MNAARMRSKPKQPRSFPMHRMERKVNKTSTKKAFLGENSCDTGECNPKSMESYLAPFDALQNFLVGLPAEGWIATEENIQDNAA